MESEIISALKSISIETLVIAFIVFALTMIIKLPIKKMTSKLDEERRRAVNSVILFIPALLALAISVVYTGCFLKIWFCKTTIDIFLSSYFLSLSIYAIIARIVVIVKGLKNGKVKSEEVKSNIDAIKEEIKNVKDAVLQVDVDSIIKKIQELKILKQSIEDSNTSNSLVSLEEIDCKIFELEEKKKSIENKK